MRHQHRALLLACIALLASACSKDKDTDAPVVRILAPTANYTLTIPDTLAVNVAAEDDNGVEGITVALSDAQGSVIATASAVLSGAPTANVYLDLAILSERIESGTYTLTARASDGENDGRAFMDITIHATPLRLRSLFIVPPTTSMAPYAVSRIDSTGTITTWASFPELSGTAIDLDHLYIAGSFTQPLVRIGVNSGAATAVLANQGALGSGISYFHGLQVDPSDGRQYVGTLDGGIRGYTANGNGSFTGWSPTGFYSEAHCVVDQQLVCALINPVSQQRLVAGFDYGSGMPMAQYPLDNAPVALFERDADHVLVFGVRNGDGVIQDRNIDQGGSFEMRLFAADPITAAVRLNDDTFILARASGVYRFGYQANAVFPLSTQAVTALAFDQATGVLWMGSGDQLIAMDPGTGAVVDTRTMPTAIGSILPLLNR